MKGPVKNRDVQEIYIVDYDGANPVRVTNSTTERRAGMVSG
jgi:hypothetical protein